jgi:hypothetical protein
LIVVAGGGCLTAQQPVQAVDVVEGGRRRRSPTAGVIAVLHDGECRSHGFVAELDALQIAGRRPERDDGQEESEPESHV